MNKLTIKNTFFCYVGFGFVLGLLAFVFIYFLTNSKPPLTPKDRYKEIRENYKIYSPPLPDSVYFAGERVPIEYIDVREALDYEILKIMYWHSETILYLKRSKRFFPTVEKYFKKYGIPSDFKYLLVAESGMTNVTSPAGAKGYWQFMKATAKEYGLEISEDVDERLNFEKSTDAACRFLKDAYKTFGSWTLAAASYNVGMDRLKNSLKNQKTNSFYDLLINRETSRYIYRIIAFKLIMENPENYGFRLYDEDFYYPYNIRIVKVDTTINSLVDFGRKYNTNYKMLKILNPWLISNKLLNPKHKTYYIKVLKDKGRIWKY